MITPELARRSRELADARQPFVTATVVRVQRPTSVLAGSVALVLADGTIEGFVGGACTEQSVKAQALVALETGEPVLLRVLPEGAEAPEEDGAVAVENPCLSGGAIEIFLEPAPPPPRVLVVGETPIAGAIVRVGEELGLEMVLSDGHDSAPAAGDLGLVVATHGRDELHALRLALEAGVPYVGLVASERRGAGVLDELRRDGVGEGLLERIDVPAGIPIGSHTPGEIAVSILARVVATRRGQTPRGLTPGGLTPKGQVPAADSGGGSVPSVSGAAPAEPAPALAVDPVCGMTVAAVASTPSVERDGETVYFCCEGCKAKFEAGEHASVAP
ncbi:MAG TPA: XdhC family protein [Solirubrobacterales bacterium]